MDPGSASPTRKRPRVAEGAEIAAAAATAPENEYEAERAARIAANKEVLRSLGLAEASAGVAAAARRAVAKPAAAPARRRRAAAAPLPAGPVRASARARGLPPSAAQQEQRGAAGDQGGAADGAADGGAAAGAGEQLLDQREYLAAAGIDFSGAVVSDGCFRGWVCPAVCAAHGIPAAPGELPAAPAAGAAPPPAAGGRGGWSAARAASSRLMLANPNSYFYRHVAPGRVQATGPWSPAEHAAFMAAARAHGAGDRWGLFASWVGSRVGYQCSAYYREVVLPAGLVLDARFRMTRGGRAVYVG